jgi:hypothetical protein
MMVTMLVLLVNDRSRPACTIALALYFLCREAPVLPRSLSVPLLRETGNGEPDASPYVHMAHDTRHTICALRWWQSFGRHHRDQRMRITPEEQHSRSMCSTLVRVDRVRCDVMRCAVVRRRCAPSDLCNNNSNAAKDKDIVDKGVSRFEVQVA